jgi:hypothetical protein
VSTKIRFETPAVNAHTAWRREVARRAAGIYAANERLAVVAVAGSVAAGVADQYSDLELDCYWREAPSNEDRLRPVEALGGDLEALWGYDEQDQEWSEDYRLGNLSICVSNFLVSTVEAFLDDVVVRADTDVVKHMRLAAVQRCLPMTGSAAVDRWRERAAGYPDELVERMVGQALTPQVLVGWSGRDALVARGDLIATYDLLARVESAILTALLAVNRVYQAHRLFKWQRATLGQLVVAPAGLAARLDALWDVGDVRCSDRAEELLLETLDLVQPHVRFSLDEFRNAIAARRTPVVAANLTGP